MMAELAESETVYSLLPQIKSSQFSRDCVVLGFRRKKTGNLVGPNSKLYITLHNIGLNPFPQVKLGKT